MLSCNGITLNYAVILYDKSKSKIQIVQETAAELPAAPVISYFLCDSWYTSSKVMDCFIRKGFYTIGALKTNRVIYPCGIRQKVSAFALHLRKSDPDVSLVTVGGREFYVYRYEGELNDIPNAAVILKYPKEACDSFSPPKPKLHAQNITHRTDVLLHAYHIFSSGRYGFNFSTNSYIFVPGAAFDGGFP